MAINYYASSPEYGGLENLVRITLDDQSELIAYGDDDKQGLAWADAIHRAVWNQPYVPVK